MSKYIVEIGDEKGNAFKIELKLSYNRRAQPRGTWRSLDKGYIKYNSGVVRQSRSKDTATTIDIYLVSIEDTWGIRLDYFEDFWGVNDEGKGEVVQPWVLALDPGTISWSNID